MNEEGGEKKNVRMWTHCNRFGRIGQVFYSTVIIQLTKCAPTHTTFNLVQIVIWLYCPT